MTQESSILLVLSLSLLAPCLTVDAAPPPIDQSRPSGVREVEDTKSGRSRRVALSRRLRRALCTLHEDRFRPGPHSLVLEGIDPDNFRAREWRRICKASGVGHRAMKDLRDTLAEMEIEPIGKADVHKGQHSEQRVVEPTLTSDDETEAHADEDPDKRRAKEDVAAMLEENAEHDQNAPVVEPTLAMIDDCRLIIADL